MFGTRTGGIPWLINMGKSHRHVQLELPGKRLQSKAWLWGAWRLYFTIDRRGVSFKIRVKH